MESEAPGRTASQGECKKEKTALRVDFNLDTLGSGEQHENLPYWSIMVIFYLVFDYNTNLGVQVVGAGPGPAPTFFFVRIPVSIVLTLDALLRVHLVIRRFLGDRSHHAGGSRFSPALVMRISLVFVRRSSSAPLCQHNPCRSASRLPAERRNRAVGLFLYGTRSMPSGTSLPSRSHSPGSGPCHTPHGRATRPAVLFASDGLHTAPLPP